MISIKKYLLAEEPAIAESAAPGLPRKRSGDSDLLPQALAAYRSALSNMGRSGVDVCPASGPDLERHLTEIARRLQTDISGLEIQTVDAEVQAELQHWGQRTAR